MTNQSPSTPKRESLNIANVKALDYFAPFFNVYISTPKKQTETKAESEDGKSRELSTQTAGGTDRSSSRVKRTFTINGEEISLRWYAANLEITASASAAYKATLELTLPYFDAIALIESKQIKFSDYMEIEWGYVDQKGDHVISDKGSFLIVQPSVTLGNNVSITITGFDGFYMSAKSLHSHCVWPRTIYKSDKDIVEKILKRHNQFDEDRTFKDLLGIKGATNSGDLPVSFFKEKDSPINQSTDDFELLSNILASHKLYYLGGNDAVVIKRAKSVDSQPAEYRLMWYSQPQNSNDIPMISFTSNTIASMFADNPARGVKGRETDMDTVKTSDTNKDGKDTNSPSVGGGNTNVTEDAFTVVGPALGFNLLKAAAAGAFLEISERHAAIVRTHFFGDQKIYPVKDDKCSSGAIMVYPKDRVNAKNDVDAENYYASFWGNTQASVTTIGHPGLIPLQVVDVYGSYENNTVIGVGSTFGGKYRIRRVTHKIGNSGYTTDLALFRSSSSGEKRDDAPKSDNPPVNKTTKRDDSNRKGNTAAEKVPTKEEAEGNI